MIMLMDCIVIIDEIGCQTNMAQVEYRSRHRLSTGNQKQSGGIANVLWGFSIDGEFGGLGILPVVGM